LLFSWRFAFATNENSAAYPGIITIGGPVQFDLSIDPPTAAPGQTLNLQLSARNQTAVTLTPSVTIQLPTQLRLQSNVLPAGTTLNFQNNSLTWQPVLAANGGAQQFALPVRVETADVTNPEKGITAVLDVNGAIQQASTTIWLGLPPQIDAIILPSQVSVGLPVQLRADTSGPGPITQFWHLGDGRQVSVNNPVIVFPVVGVYDVALEASNVVGSSAASRRITVVPHPAAQFTVDDATPGIGQVVTFINQSGGQQPVAYQWDFGDGLTSADLNPTHQYAVPGAYTVRLTVENEYGRSEAVWPITVGQPPAADMELPLSVPAGQLLSAQGFGDETITDFVWDMGDGRSENGRQISHVYLAQGDYYVTMTALNEFGGTQVGQWLHVDPGTLSLYLPAIMRAGDALPGGQVGEDPFAISLDPVDLDAPFVMEPLDLPAGTSQAEALLIYVNEARRQFDLKPLKYVYELSAAAQDHTADMAAYQYTGHTGADGSFPAERLLWRRYQGAYAGEATAWGFEEASQAVEFWVNSPDHRRIILNQWATDVGVAFTQDFQSPNIWYWTAEFGNAFGAAATPLLRVQSPASGDEVLNTFPVTYSWNWPAPLEPGQQFTVYLADEDGREKSLGVVTSPAYGTRYRFQGAVLGRTEGTGVFEWLVRLEDGARLVLQESERRSLTVLWDPELPTPTPQATAVYTPTPPRMHPTVTPRPTVLPPELVTATPVP
jgi:PKD repeat protein